jgi:hypothetical protein
MGGHDHGTQAPLARAISRHADASNGRPTRAAADDEPGAAIAFRTAGGSGDRNDGGESAARTVTDAVCSVC